MNEKASVTKELNEKHRKTLEGLLKLPENMECADCKSKGPRWASVNLGIFVCMQCSGIHRSLGVHISKVRSATLDTWLPEQVAFMQTMGNEKANSYWEAELPPKYDRVGIENFIRAKYEDKRWIPRNKTSKPPSKAGEQKTSELKENAADTGGHESASNLTNPESHDVHRSRNARKENLVVPRLPSLVSSIVKIEPVKSEPCPSISSEASPTTVEGPISSVQKTDNCTNLFDMLSVEDPPRNGLESSPAADDNWANFKSAGATTISNYAATNSVESKHQKTASGVEELFQDLPAVTTVESRNGKTTSEVEELFKDTPVTTLPPNPEKPQANMKNDIMSLFDKANMVSLYAIHQQQLAYLTHQQAVLMAAAKSSSGAPTVSTSRTDQLDPNSFKVPNVFPMASWANITPRVPGTLPIAEQHYPNLSQLGNINLVHQSGSFGALPTSGAYADGAAQPIKEEPKGRASGKSASSSPATTPNQSLGDFDFSSLTQGMFSKR